MPFGFGDVFATLVVATLICAAAAALLSV